MTQDPSAKAADPSTSHVELYELARTRPDLRAKIAANPNTYPALLEWLAGLNDGPINAALARRQSSESETAVQPSAWDSTQVLPQETAGGQPTEEFGAVQPNVYREEPTAVQPPVAPRRDFDQQVYGSPTPYSASPHQQIPPRVYYPEDDAAPPKKRGGACLLIFLLLLLTAAALAIAYYFLAGNPFADDEPEPDDQSSPAPDDEDEQDAEDSEEGETADPEDSPAPTNEEDEDPDDAELESPTPDDALSITEFSSPTGNINCQLSADDVVCTVVEFDFEAPSECSNGVTFRVNADGQADIDCSINVDSQGQALGYGDVTGNDSFACQAHELYFECWSQRTGNGFEIAREYYDLHNG